MILSLIFHFMSRKSSIPPDKDTKPGGLGLDETFMDLDWDDEKTDVDIDIDPELTQIVDMNEILPPKDSEVPEIEPDDGVDLTSLCDDFGDRYRRHATILPKDFVYPRSS